MRKKSIAHSKLTKAAIVLITALTTTVAWSAPKEKILFSFTGGNDGGDPASTLVLDTAGNLYGTTVVGGTSANCTGGCGTAFELTPNSKGPWKETVLHNFSAGSDGKNPYGGLTFDNHGNLYGTTVSGGSGGICSGDGCGTVFKLSRSGKSWTENVIYAFQGDNGKDGFGPGGAVIFDSNGNLFATTPDGGTHQLGTVYELSPTHGGQWKERVIHNFAGGVDGATGALGPLLWLKGVFYGVAETQGEFNFGTAFELTRSGGGWKLNTLHSFQGAPNDAGSPYGGLISDRKGNLYGATYFGGTLGNGAVYKLSKNTRGKWQETVLYSFQGGTDGSNPTTTLVFDRSGNLYGTTTAGGDTNGDGTIFKLTPESGGKWKETVVHRFNLLTDGASPSYGLILDKTSNLYGTTAIGGRGGQGVVFELAP